ncbi:hypothetical protein PybrP1_011748 [[Pythium] brassicae (nom. inval.)]|nr:hypothetical protein PybrP1_011748 [[Pythium] brassicae (nom. inval.)]
MAHDSCVLRMQCERISGARCFVFTDESYVHRNYSCHDDSLYGPNDEPDLQVKARHKGRRLCIVAAIVGADERVPAESRTPSQCAHLLRWSLDVFEGGNQTVDYHGMFNSTYYLRWIERLLEQLPATNISNALIVLDNAKYHKTLPHDTPKTQCIESKHADRVYAIRDRVQRQ